VYRSLRKRLEVAKPLRTSLSVLSPIIIFLRMIRVNLHRQFLRFAELIRLSLLGTIFIFILLGTLGLILLLNVLKKPIRLTLLK
jgi:hypothetical protein